MTMKWSPGCQCCGEPGCGACGDALYTWDDTAEVWNLTTDNCVSPCILTVPTEPGTTEGEEVTVCCNSCFPFGEAYFTWLSTLAKWALTLDDCDGSYIPPDATNQTNGVSDGQEATFCCRPDTPDAGNLIISISGLVNCPAIESADPDNSPCNGWALSEFNGTYVIDPGTMTSPFYISTLVYDDTGAELGGGYQFMRISWGVTATTWSWSMHESSDGFVYTLRISESGDNTGSMTTLDYAGRCDGIGTCTTENVATFTTTFTDA